MLLLSRKKKVLINKRKPSGYFLYMLLTTERERDLRIKEMIFYRQRHFKRNNQLLISKALFALL